MGPPRSQKAAKTEKKVQEALAGLESGKCCNPHATAQALGISTATMNHRANRGLSHQEANCKILLLSYQVKLGV